MSTRPESFIPASITGTVPFENHNDGSESERCRSATGLPLHFDRDERQPGKNTKGKAAAYARGARTEPLLAKILEGRRNIRRLWRQR